MFLPRIRKRLIAALTLASLACPGCDGSGTVTQANATAVVLGHVVAATGDPPAALVADVQRIVVAEEPALVTLFRGRPHRPYVVHVHGRRDALPDAIAASLHVDSPGFAMLGGHQIHLVGSEVLRLGANLRGVVVHEMVHEFLDQFVEPNGRRMPRWFHEGLAQSVAGDTYLGAREEELVLQAVLDRLPASDSLREDFPQGRDALRLAYAQSYSYVAWLTREYGLGKLLDIAAAADDLTSFERALVGRTRLSTLDLETRWKEYLLGSGAPWRVLLDQCFTLMLVAALPLLALALIRRLAVDRRAAERLERADAEERAAAAREQQAAEMDDGQRRGDESNW